MNPIIDEDGNQLWYNEHGRFHRSDGPAVIYSDGDQHWYFNGKRHRTDGPAIIYPNGTQLWYIYGNRLTEAEYYDIIQSEEHLTWYLLQL